jgi:E3 Ubiquitin ligase
MSIPLLILGAVLLLVALVCALVAWNSEGRLAAIRDAPSSTAQDVLLRYRHDGGAFGQVCEVAGVVECDASIDGPISGRPCAIVSHSVTWEEWGQPTTFGRNTYDTNMVLRGSSTEVNDRHVPTFWVRDATGRVLVDPLMATFDLQPLDERYEVMTASSGGNERRAWHTEKGLPVGQQVYVLGYMGEQNGQPVLRRHPRDRDKKFIISYRSEQELTRATNRRANLFYTLAALAGIGGILLVGWQVLQRGR